MKWLLSALMVLLLAVPAFAFNLDVLCPTNAFLPGDEVSCNLRLREATPRELFVMQADVMVTPEGYIRGSTPYLDAIAPVAGEAGAVTAASPTPRIVLFTLNPVVLQSNIATLRFRIAADAQAGDYRVELQDVESGNAALPFENSNAGVIRIQLPGQRIVRLGDVNNDNQINVLDIMRIIEHITGPRTLISIQTADTDCNGTVDVLDIIEIINYITANRTDRMQCPT